MASAQRIFFAGSSSACCCGDWNRFEDFDDEDDFAGYLQEALAEGAEGFVSALADVAVARLISRLAESSGVGRSELCQAFAGHLALGDASLAKVAKAAMEPEMARV